MHLQDDELSASHADVEVLVRRDGDDSFSMVSWKMSPAGLLAYKKAMRFKVVQPHC